MWNVQCIRVGVVGRYFSRELLQCGGVRVGLRGGPFVVVDLRIQLLGGGFVSAGMHRNKKRTIRQQWSSMRCNVNEKGFVRGDIEKGRERREGEREREGKGKGEREGESIC